MARIRTIKPEFWTDDAITECSLSARLLFIGTWNFADDGGNLDRSAKQIKVRVFPIDDIDCEPLLSELVTHGLLIEYSVSDKKYLHIPGFIEHQVINRPSKPSCPAYEDSLRTQGVLTEPSVSTPVSWEGKGSIGKGSGRKNGNGTPGVPIPIDFTITDELRTQALTRIPDVDPDELFVQFRAHHESHGKIMKSWPAAWTTWIGNAVKFGYPRKQNTERKWD